MARGRCSYEKIRNIQRRRLPSRHHSADLRHVVDFFHWYGTQEPIYVDRPDTLTLGPQVKAVKVACPGDQKLFGAKPFENMVIPGNHDVLRSSAFSGISNRLGFSLAFHKLSAELAVKAMSQGCCIPGITFAMMDDNPASPGWGWAPLDWRGGRVPSCLVFRKDKKPLVSQQMKAFLRFSETIVREMFNDSTGENYSARTREEVLGNLNPRNFNEFFEQYRSDKIKNSNGDDHVRNVWSTVQCPTKV